MLRIFLNTIFLIFCGAAAVCGPADRVCAADEYAPVMSLAPPSRSSGEDSEMMRAGRALVYKKTMMAIRKKLSEAFTLEKRIDLVRKIYAIADKSKEATEDFLNLSLDGLDEADLVGFLERTSAIAREFIDSRLIAPADNIRPITNPESLNEVDNFIFSAPFFEKYVDLSRGKRLLIDFGAGSIPFSAREFERRASRFNRRIEVKRADDLGYFTNISDFPADEKADLIRAANVLAQYRNIKMLAPAFVEFERRLAEGGVLIAGLIPEEAGFGLFAVYQKRGGRLVPREIVFTGFLKDSFAGKPAEALMAAAQRRAADMSPLRIWDKTLIEDFSDLNEAVANGYAATKDMRTAAKRALGTMREKGYPGFYDPENGFLTFRFDPETAAEAGNIRLVRGILSDIALKSGLAKQALELNSAVRSLTPLFKLRAARNGMTLEGYRDFLARGAAGESKLIDDILEGSRLYHKDLPLHSYFFREYSQWGDELEAYIKILIPLKLKKGDFSINVKSIGSSTGKEAYSIGSMVYQALKEYAEAAVFKDIKSDEEKMAMVEEWINRWDVRLEAFDRSLSYLDAAVEGEGAWSGTNDEMDKEPAAAKYKAFIKVQKGYRYTVDEKLRRWLIPVCADFENSDLLPLIDDSKGEIIFCRNTVVYVGLQDRDKNVIAKKQAEFINAVMRSAREDYPVFLSLDKEFAQSHKAPASEEKINAFVASGKICGQDP